MLDVSLCVVAELSVTPAGSFLHCARHKIQKLPVLHAYHFIYLTCETYLSLKQSLSHPCTSLVHVGILPSLQYIYTEAGSYSFPLSHLNNQELPDNLSYSIRYFYSVVLKSNHNPSEFCRVLVYRVKFLLVAKFNPPPLLYCHRIDDAYTSIAHTGLHCL